MEGTSERAKKIWDVLKQPAEAMPYPEIVLRGYSSAVDSLPEDDRDAWDMHFDGYEVGEIAEILDRDWREIDHLIEVTTSRINREIGLANREG